MKKIALELPIDPLTLWFQVYFSVASNPRPLLPPQRTETFLLL
jgi:hypothetical protein